MPALCKFLNAFHYSRFILPIGNAEPDPGFEGPSPWHTWLTKGVVDRRGYIEFRFFFAAGFIEELNHQLL